MTPAGEPVFAWLDDSTGHMGLHARRGAAPPVTLDPEACECCGTALLAGPKGEIWLAYRDAQDDVRDFRVLRAGGAGSGFDPGRPLSADGRQELLAQVRDPRTGTWEPARQVAPGGRYPRWAARGKEAVVAFTCGTGGGSQVVVADWAMAAQGELAGMECVSAGSAHSGH